MASSTRACAISKCKISSCAICHCCQHDLCLDHLKEHKDQLNVQLTPFANQINIFVDNLEHITPTSSPSFQILEQWRVAAHESVDRFYERLRHDFFEQKKNRPLEKLRVTRNHLDQLIQRHGATRENINSLTNDIRLIEQEINELQNIQINLRPLIIDDQAIIGSDTLNRSNQTASASSEDSNTNGSFQIFVQLLNGQKIFIMIKSTDTIIEFKRKIEGRAGIPPEQQYLTYMGKILKDEYSAGMYDIQRLCTINCSIRLKN